MPITLQPPRVTVLLATFNGRRWLPEQLASILEQRAVDVTVVVLDDHSTDGTREWLAEIAANDRRVLLLPPDPTPSGGAAANFYRLIERAPLNGADWIAFSDQDDIWMPDKLSRHAAILADGDMDGISSNVTSFSPDGRRHLIRKSFPQREFDFLLESPGPGSTFLMSPRLVGLVRNVLIDDPDAVAVAYHDWLVYAVARAHGLRWHIDSQSTLDYRQHSGNAMGANVGSASAISRLDLIRQKWHRGQAVLLARIGLRVADPAMAPGLAQLLDLMVAKGARARMALVRRSGALRRRPRDRRIIGLLILMGVW